MQLSGKVDSTQQPLRLGVFDLLQKVRLNRGGEPITSNLPSENIAREIGSKRLEGTGRTYGNLLKKRKDAGIGIGGRRGTEEGHEDELTFLKNAMGQEIAFELERGSGARANLLATKGRIRNKLVDAAAMVVGVDLGVVTQVIFEAKERRALAKKRKMEEKEEGAAGGGKKKKKKGGSELYFLKDNLDVTSSAIGGAGAAGLSKDEKEKRRLGYLGGDNDNDSSSDDEGDDEKESFFVTDETDELRNLPEDERRILFQAQYKIEVERQKKLLGITTSPSQSHPGIVSDENWDDGAENGAVEWEDG